MPIPCWWYEKEQLLAIQLEKCLCALFIKRGAIHCQGTGTRKSHDVVHSVPATSAAFYTCKLEQTCHCFQICSLGLTAYTAKCSPMNTLQKEKGRFNPARLSQLQVHFQTMCIQADQLHCLTSYIIGLVSNFRQKSKQLSEVMQVYIAMSEIGDLLYNTGQAM